MSRAIVKHTIGRDDHLTLPCTVIDKDGKVINRFESNRQARRHIRDIIKGITLKRHEARIRAMENR